MTAGSTSGTAGTTPTPTTAPASTEKVLRIALQGEPTTFTLVYGGTQTVPGGQHQPKEMVHNWLTYTDANNLIVPSLAAELPSLDNGTWQINLDGTMTQTWQLRRNVVWHDGTPFTATDIAFGWEAATDPALRVERSVESRLIEAVEVLGPYTLVLHWRQIWVDGADLGHGTIDPLPRHLLGESLAQDKDGFLFGTFWWREFVGLGPFRVASWQLDSHIELTRFEPYYRGPARIDRILIRFIPDANDQVLGILRGEFDLLLPTSIDVDRARTLKERWAGTQNRVLVGQADVVHVASVQFRGEVLTEPALSDPRVRRGLNLALDRATIADLGTQGLGTVADSFVGPNDPLRRDVETAIPLQTYDSTAGAQALSEAGWSRGPDGTLRNEEGRALQFGVQMVAQGRSERQLALLTDGWKQLGAQVEARPLSFGSIRDRESWTSFAGMDVRPASGRSFYVDRLHTSQTMGAHNRWAGTNTASYANPEVDALLDRLTVTVPRADRVTLARDLVRLVMDDLAILPLYWEVETIAARGTVRNVPPPSSRGKVHTWNIAEWELDG